MVSIARWDERVSQPIDDYGDQHRVMRRVTLGGDIPVGVDGRPSLQRKPVPATSLAAE